MDGSPRFFGRAKKRRASRISRRTGAVSFARITMEGGGHHLFEESINALCGIEAESGFFEKQY